MPYFFLFHNIYSLFYQDQQVNMKKVKNIQLKLLIQLYYLPISNKI